MEKRKIAPERKSPKPTNERAKTPANSGGTNRSPNPNPNYKPPIGKNR